MAERLFQALTFWLLTQLPTGSVHIGKQLKHLSPATHIGNLEEILDPWHQPGSTLAIADVWGVQQDKFTSFPISLL